MNPQTTIFKKLNAQVTHAVHRKDIYENLIINTNNNKIIKYS